MIALYIQHSSKHLMTGGNPDCTFVDDFVLNVPDLVLFADSRHAYFFLYFDFFFQIWMFRSLVVPVIVSPPELMLS